MYLFKMTLIYFAIVVIALFLTLASGYPPSHSPNGMTSGIVVALMFTYITLPFLTVTTVIFCCCCCCHSRRGTKSVYKENIKEVNQNQNETLNGNECTHDNSKDKNIAIRSLMDDMIFNIYLKNVYRGITIVSLSVLPLAFAYANLKHTL
eukprot:TCONS_00013944-protein